MSFEFRLEVWEKEEKKEDLLSCGTLNILQELFELKASTKPYWLDDPNLYSMALIDALMTADRMMYQRYFSAYHFYLQHKLDYPKSSLFLEKASSILHYFFSQQDMQHLSKVIKRRITKSA